MKQLTSITEDQVVLVGYDVKQITYSCQNRMFTHFDDSYIQFSSWLWGNEVRDRLFSNKVLWESDANPTICSFMSLTKQKSFFVHEQDSLGKDLVLFNPLFHITFERQDVQERGRMQSSSLCRGRRAAAFSFLGPNTALSGLCTIRERRFRMYLFLSLNGPDPGDPEMPGDAGRRRPGAGHSSTHLPDFFKYWIVIVWAEYLWLPFKWMEVTRRWLGDVFETNLGTHGFHSNHRIEWM